MPKTKEEREAAKALKEQQKAEKARQKEENKAEKKRQKQMKSLEKMQRKMERKQAIAEMKEEFKQTKVGQKLVKAKDTVTRAKNTLEVGAHRKKEALKDRIKATGVYQKAKEAKKAVKDKIKNTDLFKRIEQTEGYKLMKSLPGLLNAEVYDMELTTLRQCKEAKSALEAIMKKKAEFEKLKGESGFDINNPNGSVDTKKLKKAVSVGEELLKQEQKYTASIVGIEATWYVVDPQSQVSEGLRYYKDLPLEDMENASEFALNVVRTAKKYIKGEVTEEEWNNVITG